MILVAGAGAIGASVAFHLAALVREPTPEHTSEAKRLRGELEHFPFHAAAKVVAARRGVPIGPDVRAPLRGLTQAELAELTLP